AAEHRVVEVAEREGDRAAGRSARIGQAELARVVVRRVDHRGDRVDVLREPAGLLADAEIAGRREAEDVDRDANAERLELFRRVVDEAGDRPRGRLRGLAGEDGA